MSANSKVQGLTILDHVMDVISLAFGKEHNKVEVLGLQVGKEELKVINGGIVGVARLETRRLFITWKVDTQRAATSLKLFNEAVEVLAELVVYIHHAPFDFIVVSIAYSKTIQTPGNVASEVGTTVFGVVNLRRRKIQRLSGFGKLIVDANSKMFEVDVGRGEVQLFFGIREGLLHNSGKLLALTCHDFSLKIVIPRYKAYQSERLTIKNLLTRDGSN